MEGKYVLNGAIIEQKRKIIRNLTRQPLHLSKNDDVLRNYYGKIAEELKLPVEPSEGTLEKMRDILVYIDFHNTFELRKLYLQYLFCNLPEFANKKKRKKIGGTTCSTAEIFEFMEAVKTKTIPSLKILDSPHYKKIMKANTRGQIYGTEKKVVIKLKHSLVTLYVQCDEKEILKYAVVVNSAEKKRETFLSNGEKVIVLLEYLSTF